MKIRRTLTAGRDDPLIGLLVEEDGREVVQYFADDAARETDSADKIARAMAAIGAFQDLDWDDMMDSLEQIRRSSTPTPPIDLYGNC